MRIQQIDNNMYIKVLDDVESYLINEIDKHIEDNNDMKINIENIIKEAIIQLRGDIDSTYYDTISLIKNLANRIEKLENMNSL